MANYKKYWKNLRTMILYSDSDMVELGCGIFIIYLAVTPVWDVDPFLRGIFFVVGILQVVALITQDLLWRNRSNIASMVFYLYLTLYGFSHGTLVDTIDSMIVTMLAIWCWTRTRRELNSL